MSLCLQLLITEYMKALSAAELSLPMLPAIFQWARRGDARLPFYRWMSNILNPFVALTKCLESTVLKDKKLSDSQLRANRE